MAIYQFSKYLYGSSLALVLAGLSSAPSAIAATFTIGEFTWDSNNAVTSVEVLQGNMNNPFFTPFPVSATIGNLLGFEENTSVSLGDNLNATLIELTWNEDQWLPNQDNEDFVIYESGSLGSPEAFAVAVRQAGQDEFTSFRYQFSNSFDSVSEVFATAFDLDDFGIASDLGIDAIQILNLTASSTVDGSDGQGFLDGGVAPQTGLLGPGDYTDDKFDPDITYVVGLQNLLNSEPPTPPAPLVTPTPPTPPAPPVNPIPPTNTQVPEPSTTSAILLLTALGLKLRRKA